MPNMMNWLKSEETDTITNILTLRPIDQIVTSLIPMPPLADIHRDLELFSANSPDSAPFLSHITATHTALGRAQLAALVATPISDIQILQTRQSIIQHIASDLITHSYITDKLKEIAANEEQALNMIMPPTDEQHALYANIFIAFQTHPLVASLYYWYVILIIPIYGILSPLLFFLIQYIIIRYIFGVEISMNLLWRIIQQCALANTFITTILNLVLNIDTATATPTNRIQYYILTISNLIMWLMSSQCGKLLYYGALIAMYLWCIYRSITISCNYYSIIKTFHTRLAHLAKWLHASHALYIRYCDHIGNGNVDGNVDGNCAVVYAHPLIADIMSNDIYMAPCHLLINFGTIVQTYKSLCELVAATPDILAPICRFIALIDVYTAMALLSVKMGPICYPIYSDAAQPLCTGYDMRNICCPVPQVTNSIELGSANGKILLITGSNGSGKSTYIKMIMLNIIMAQTCGIAFAKSMTITPFAHLTTYLNIPDCNGKESLFQAELRRCDDFMSNIRTWDAAGARSINIIDEIFVSTNYCEGISCAAAILNALAAAGGESGALIILITHYDLLDKIEEAHRTNIAAAHFALEFAPDNTVRCDYKLKPGYLLQHNAIKLLQNKGFAKTIVDHAMAVYNGEIAKQTEEKPQSEINTIHHCDDASSTKSSTNGD
jgi:energy-coupling factor transporter ATP-binding protein EcfA2